MKDILVDITGKRFGRLTVIKRDIDHINPNTQKHYPQWLCRCDCGKYKVILGQNLKRGLTRSCGCYASEVKSQIHKKHNDYEIYGEKYLICHFINSSKYFICDIEDLELIKNYTWALSKNNTAYARTKINNTIKTIYVYNLIMNTPSGKIIDHINGNRLDNRKNNLRICTQQENTYNQRIRSDNVSGHKGVYFDKNRNKWAVQIQSAGKRHFLGRFDNINDAIITYEKAEEKYFGQYGTKISRNGYI